MRKMVAVMALVASPAGAQAYDFMSSSCTQSLAMRDSSLAGSNDPVIKINGLKVDLFIAGVAMQRYGRVPDFYGKTLREIRIACAQYPNMTMSDLIFDIVR